MNVLYIMSDQHQQKVAGCYGHPFVKTPNIDRLAATGTRFASAYTTSPICVPARATLATGRYAHETRYWDNAHAYDGRVKSWHHMLQDQGTGAVSIGKLHFRQEDDPTGLVRQVIPMHIVDGIGDLKGCVKRPMAPPFKESKVATRIGPGESPYTKYDREIAERGRDWLRQEAAGHKGRPWVLFCSFVCPHPPHIAPPDFYGMYPIEEMPIPKLSDPDAPLHPWIALQQRSRNHDDFLNADSRRVLMASYFGCTSFLDDNVGKLLDCLEECGLSDDTVVIYTSDHGENLGARRLWGKSNMYEEANAVPMILGGPGVPAGKVSATAVTLADIAPTILDAVGLGETARAEGLPGRSLLEIAGAEDDPERIAFSEYFAASADRATFMIRRGAYKYIHYVGYEPELFDLGSDPEEIDNLAKDPAHRSTLDEYEGRLRAMVDPEAVDEQAYRDQVALVEKHGGRDAVLARGSLQGTPAPGEEAEFVT